MGVVLSFPIGHAQQHAVDDVPCELELQPPFDGVADSEEVALRCLAREIASDPHAVAGGIETVIDEQRLAVWKQGSFRGVWRVTDTRYEWVPAAYLIPAVVVHNVYEAARATVCLALRPARLEANAFHARLAALGDGHCLASSVPAAG